MLDLDDGSHDEDASMQEVEKATGANSSFMADMFFPICGKIDGLRFLRLRGGRHLAAAQDGFF